MLFVNISSPSAETSFPVVLFVSMAVRAGNLFAVMVLVV